MGFRDRLGGGALGGFLYFVRLFVGVKGWALILIFFLF